jgi:hypothetical protein
MTREEAINYFKRSFVGGSTDDERQHNEALDMAIKALEKEQCADAISRKAALETILTKVPDFCGGDEGGNLIYRNETASYIRNLPSVTPKQKTGHWFYDKSIENWRCSECKETPKTMGYCGSVNFMVEHFKFCNHCGAKMEGGKK